MHLRGAHADEVDVRAGRVRHVRAEAQPARGPRLRRAAPAGRARRTVRVPSRSASIFLRVDVDADDVVAQLGHARGVDGTEVAATDDREAHRISRSQSAPDDELPVRPSRVSGLGTEGTCPLSFAHHDLEGEFGRSVRFRCRPRWQPAAAACSARWWERRRKSLSSLRSRRACLPQSSRRGVRLASESCPPTAQRRGRRTMPRSQNGHASETRNRVGAGRRASLSRTPPRPRGCTQRARPEKNRQIAVVCRVHRRARHRLDLSFERRPRVDLAA